MAQDIGNLSEVPSCLDSNEKGDINIRGIDEKYIYELNRNSKIIDEVPDIFTEEPYRHGKTIEKAGKLGVGYRRYEHGRKT